MRIFIIFLSIISFLYSDFDFNMNKFHHIKFFKHKSKNTKTAKNSLILSFKDGVDLKDMKREIKQTFHHKIKIKEYQSINGLYLYVKDTNKTKIENDILNNDKISSNLKAIEEDIAYKILTNDTYYIKQWAIENNGQTVNGISGKKDADLDIKEAWSITKGDLGAVVAILDTGIDYTHEDLADNMWRGNIKHGYDFAGDNDGNNDDDPMPDLPYDQDGHSHGTHVAGIIGAVGNNDLGVSGVAQNIQLMALKVFRPNGYGYSSDLLEALEYIIEQKDKGVNIVVVNASYGGESGEDGDSISRAIEKLNQRGIIFCAAAGNNGKDIDKEPIYPASYKNSNIISVASTNQDDNLSSFSNYGKNSVDVAAPGENILSTYPDNQYAYMQGTSMATPYISGIVALIKSSNPDASTKDIVSAIKSSIDKKISLEDKIVSGGRVNAYSALRAISNSNNPPIAKDDNVSTSDKTILIDVLSNDLDMDGDILTIINTSKPKNGSVRIVNNKIEYTPNSNYSGDDSFEYIISDNKGATASAKVYLEILKSVESKNSINEANSMSQPNDDNIEIYKNESILANVLRNDNIDGNLTLISITNPKNGVAKIVDNRVYYKPNIDFIGNDTLSYTFMQNNKNRYSANIYITIKPYPIKANSDTYKIKEDNKAYFNVLKNDKYENNISIVDYSNPEHGVLRLVDNKFEYIPNSNYYGKDSFIYTIKDSNGFSSTAKVFVDIESVNDEPLAFDDNVTTYENRDITIDLLKNDLDLDGDKIYLKSITKPQHGRAIIEGNLVKYTPNKDFYGNDTFTYIVSDSKVQKSANVYIRVKSYVEDYKPIKVDIIEKIIKLFDPNSPIDKDVYNFSFDNAKGRIKILKSLKKINIYDRDTLFPKDYIGNLKDFNYKDSLIEIEMDLDSTLRF